ncbi:hypothetical protein BKA83DRAFT_4340758, partial [Pisolithus microcarpus]
LESRFLSSSLSVPSCFLLLGCCDLIVDNSISSSYLLHATLARQRSGAPTLFPNPHRYAISLHTDTFPVLGYTCITLYYPDPYSLLNVHQSPI